ncbi:MAG: hypothetical protein ABIH04_07030 [Planctomycetota bacterium]
MCPSKKFITIQLLLFAVFSLPALAQDIDPLALLPEDTSVLVKVDFQKFVKAYFFKHFKESLLEKIPGYPKFIKLLEDAQLSPLDTKENKPLEYVKEIYLAKAGLDESEDDVVALIIGTADLEYTMGTLKDKLPDKIVKMHTTEKGEKFYETHGLLSKDETLYFVQVVDKQAIGVARTREAALAFLARAAQEDAPKGIRKNKSLNTLANKVIPADSEDAPFLAVIVTIDEKQRKKFAESDDADTNWLQHVESAYLQVNTSRSLGGLNIEAHCKCTSEEAAEKIKTSLDILRIKAALVAHNAVTRDILKSFEAQKTREKASLKISSSLYYIDPRHIIDEIKLLTLGPDKEAEEEEEAAAEAEEETEEEEREVEEESPSP